MTHAVNHTGVRMRPDLAERTAQARLADRVGDMADQVSLAVHRQLNGRDWTIYAAAVERAAGQFASAAESLRCSTNPRTRLTGVKTVRLINRYGTAVGGKNTDRGAADVHSSDFSDTAFAEMLGEVDKQLQRLVDRSIDNEGLVFLQSFFDALANSTLDSGRDRGER